MKLCINCQYHKHHLGHRCYATAHQWQDLVDGKIHTVGTVLCSENRNEGKPCGPNGNLYAKKTNMITRLFNWVTTYNKS